MNKRMTRTAAAVRGAVRSTGDYLHGVEHDWIEDMGRPIEVMMASVIGLVATATGDVDETVFPPNKPVLVNSDKFIAKAGNGPLREALEDIYRQGGALVVVVRAAGTVTKGSKSTDDPITGGVGPDANGNYVGMQALLAAESIVGVRPTILMVNTGKQVTKDQMAALSTVANKLHAIPVFCLQNGGLAAATTFTKELDEAYAVYGRVSFGNDSEGKPIYRDATATVCGHIMRVDNEEGYWNSPSSRKILGVVSMESPVDHQIGSKTSTANLMNKDQMTVIVQQKGGFYLYGNRLTGPKQMLLPHQRIRYIVGLSIQEAHQELVDRNVTANYVESVKARVNNLLTRLVQREVISGGECWVDGELNKTLIGTNQVIWDYDLGFYDVAERMTFRQHVNRSYSEAVYG